MSASRRGYDRQYRNAREEKLRIDPLCEDCLERDETTIAVETHHIEKVAARPDLRAAIDNLRSVCKKCHDVRTARGE